MKAKAVIHAVSATLLLSLLTACGGSDGGGGSGNGTPNPPNNGQETAESSRIFFATNPDDAYVASYLKGSESLTLLGETTGTDPVDSILLYLSGRHQIEVIKRTGIDKGICRQNAGIRCAVP